MVSLFIVSHSEKIAYGLKELALEMAPEVKIAATGGTIEGHLGSSYDKIYKALSDIYTEEGVIVLFDLGSSYMTAELVKESLAIEGKDKIHIVDAALVEGALTAAVQISLGLTIDEIVHSLGKLKLGKM